MAPLQFAPRVIRVPHLKEDEFWLHASAADVCINLRFPTAGETSGIGVRLMGIGKTVLFTSGEEVARYPEEVCLQVDPGLAEHAMLAEYMAWLANDAGAAREIGRRASEYIRAFHGPSEVASRFWQVLTNAL